MGGGHAPACEQTLELVALGKPAGGDRGEEGTDVDAHVENREAGVAADVAGLIETADHGADVGLEHAGAHRDERQP